MDKSYLIEELNAPFPSIRLYAIEQIVQNDPFPGVLEALLKRRETEDDSECLMLLEHAIRKLQARVQGLSSSITCEVPADNFQKEFAGKSPSEKIAMLDNLSIGMRRELAPQAVVLAGVEHDPMVRATLLRVFARVWPRTHLKDITLFLKSDHLSTRVASLEILIQQAPELLSRDLPKLLVSRDPRVRALAVRGLAKIDLEDALAHLEVLFESGNSTHVIAALQNTIFFPFERIKPMLLKIVAIEKDPAMLVRIGIFLENNPDPEIPFRLWELSESANPEKETFLRGLVKSSCRNIEESGILGDKCTEYQKKLQNWINERAVSRWMQDVVNRLSAPDTNLIELEAMVRPRLKQEAVRLTCQKALGWPIPEVARVTLQQWLQPVSAPMPQPLPAPAIVSPKPSNHPTAPVPPEPPTSLVQSNLPCAPAQPTPVIDAHPQPSSLEQFNSLSHDQQIRALSSLDTPTDASVKILLDEIFKQAESPPDLLASSVRTALRFDLASYTNHARRHLKSKDPNLTQACLEFLGKLDPDWLSPFLGTYLQSDNLRIKSCALRLLKKSDPKQSLSTLKTMLFSKNPEQQKASLACLIHFDFSLVRSMLCDFLRQAKDPEILNPGLLFFQANPESGNLYALYLLEKRWRDDNWLEMADFAQNIRRENEKALIESGQLEALPAQTREEDFAKRFAEERSRAAKAPSPYRVKKPSESGSSSIAEFLEFLKNEWRDKSPREIGGMVWGSIADLGRQHPGVSALGLIFVVGFWVFIGIDSRETGVVRVQGTTVLASSVTMEGVVQEASSSGLVVKGNDGKTYAVYPPDGRKFIEDFSGKKVRVQLLPYQIDENKVIRGNLQKISRL